jgi:hypothetical protein
VGDRVQHRGRTSPAAGGRPLTGSLSRTGPLLLMMTPARLRRRRHIRGAGQAPGGVSRLGELPRQDLPGRVQHAVGATCAGEPVEVVTAGGLVDILHAGSWSPRTCNGCAPTRPTGYRGPGVARKTRDATKDLTVIRLAKHRRHDRLRRNHLPGRRQWARTFIDVTIVAGSVQLSRSARSPESTRSATPAPASSARSPTPKAARAARTPPSAMSPSCGTDLSPRYRN